MSMPMSTTHPTAAAAASTPPGLPDAPQSLLRMAVGADTMAVSIDDVREILEVGRLTALPRTPDFVRGVMNLRGAVVPVIDLAARVGQPAIQIGRRSCVVVVEAGGGAGGAAGGGAGSAAGGGAGADLDADGDADDTAGHDPLAGTLVVGLLVDAVFEVFDVPASSIEPAPALGTRIDASFLRGMARARGEVIGVLALDRVLAQHELSALIASHVPH